MKCSRVLAELYVQYNQPLSNWCRKAYVRMRPVAIVQGGGADMAGKTHLSLLTNYCRTCFSSICQKCLTVYSRTTYRDQAIEEG